MSEQPTTGTVPSWDIADRMRKALRESGIGVAEMGDYLGVSRNTVSTWINGRIEPSRQTVRLWALRTGVPYVWLETGVAPRGGPDMPTAPDEDAEGRGLRARRDSNPKPSDLVSALVARAA